jgi:double zinc ribbon protein
VSPIFRRHGRRLRSTIPPAGVLRRERRALLQFREERLRDLGGLLLEMFRRDRFREDLIRERCEELLEVDDHLAAIDSLLGLSWTLPDQARCACGAPVMDGAEFCAACGRPVGDASRQCAACGSALAAEAAFCSRCGMRTDARAVRQAEPAAEIEAQPAAESQPQVAEFTES